jgi:hypothetical protein
MKNINWKIGVKEYLYNGSFVLGIFVLCLLVMFCGNRTGKEMGAKRTITTEEASWTQSRSWGKGDWYNNFKVIE